MADEKTISGATTPAPLSQEEIDNLARRILKGSEGDGAANLMTAFDDVPDVSMDSAAEFDGKD